MIIANLSNSRGPRLMHSFIKTMRDYCCQSFSVLRESCAQSLTRFSLQFIDPLFRIHFQCHKKTRGKEERNQRRFGIDSSFNLESFQFFPAPLENQCREPQLINTKMGKRMQTAGSQQSIMVVRDASCPNPSTQQHDSSLEHLKGNFLQLLTHLHRQPSNQQTENQSEGKQSALLANFLQNFNNQKYYSKIELHCYVICLANLITIGDSTSSLMLTHEFRIKIRRFLQDLVQEDANTCSYANKVQAVFYILAVIIFQERAAKKRSGKKNYRSIVADKGIVKAFLDISIPNRPRISKFYGIIMVAITARSHTKLMREVIIKNILLNLSQVNHQQTLFNLLAYLRSEKNKIRITFSHLIEGDVIKVLSEGYERYIQQYQSYYMLDYINHLLVLFPQLAAAAVSKEFVLLLVRHLHLRNMHHPMHETTIFSFIGRGLKLLEERQRQIIITSIYEIEFAEIYTQSKIVKMLIELDSSANLLARIIENNILMPFIPFISINLEKNVLLNTVQMLLMAIQKVQLVNLHVGRYLLWLVKNKVRLMGDSELLARLSALE